MHKHIKKSFVHGPLLGVWFGFPLCLHHLVDLAPLLAVLGEGLAVVSSQLDSLSAQSFITLTVLTKFLNLM